MLQQLPEIEIQTVATEQAFEEALQRPVYDLAILDYFFPGSHGLVLMQQLRRARPRTPVIFFCSALEASIEKRIFEAGPDDFIYKNSSGFLLLAKAVKRHLARARLNLRTSDLPSAGLRQLLDRASLGLFRADEKGNLLDATVTLVRLLEADSIAQVRELEHCWRAPRVQPVTNGGGAEASNAESTQYEVELTTAKGNRRWYSIVEEVSSGEAGRKVVVGVIQDISDRKQVERQAKQLEQQLNEFASLASHQLHEPLRQVREYTRLLLEDHSQRLDSEGQEFLHFAHDASKRMRGMVDDLLQLVRSGQDVRFENCDTNWLVEEAILNLKPTIDASGARIHWDSLPMLRADCKQMLLVFQNLISNAIKFYRGEDVPHIRIWAAEQDSELRITFQDNGMGIEPQDLETIFESFGRLHPDIPGIGLGLPICRRIVEKHNGRIWADSKPGEGSSFVIALPK